VKVRGCRRVAGAGYQAFPVAGRPVDVRRHGRLRPLGDLRPAALAALGAPGWKVMLRTLVKSQAPQYVQRSMLQSGVRVRANAVASSRCR